MALQVNTRNLFDKITLIFTFSVRRPETAALHAVLITNRDPTPRIKFHNHADPAANFVNLGEEVLLGQLVSTISGTERAVVKITDGNQDDLFRLETVGDRHYVRVAKLPEMRTRTEFQLTVEARDRDNSSIVTTSSLQVKVDTFPQPQLDGQFNAVLITVFV